MFTIIFNFINATHVKSKIIPCCLPFYYTSSPQLQKQWYFNNTRPQIKQLNLIEFLFYSSILYIRGRNCKRKSAILGILYQKNCHMIILPPIFVNISKNIKYLLTPCTCILNRIGGVMVSVLASSVVDRGFEPRSGQTKDYKIGICCFSAKHAALRRKSKGWLARNQDNVSEQGGMSICGLLFQ